MAYIAPKQSAIPTPKSATLELHSSLVASKIAFFEPVFTKELLVTESKHCYSIIINSVNAQGLRLEELLGTDNAKSAVSQIMFALLTGHTHTD